MDVSIIIINYNTSELLKDCIKSVVEHTKDVSYEVIIVDNNSEFFNPEEYVYIGSNIKILQLTDNLGFGKANNEGIKISLGEFVLFLNSDTILMNDAISILCKYMRDNVDVGICGGNLYTKDGKPNMSYTESFPTVADYMRLLMGMSASPDKDSNFNNTEKPKVLGGYVSGADLMIRRDLLERYGGFDPGFFMYFEDVELCYRISRRGLLIASVPSAKIIHLQGGSTTSKGEEMSIRSRCFLLASEFVYFSKIDGSLKVRMLWILYMIKSLLAFLFYSCTGNNNKQIYWNSILSVLKNVRFKKII